MLASRGKKNCARGIVLTTDRHEASRGLFATTELLVLYPLAFDAPVRGGGVLVGVLPRNKKLRYRRETAQSFVSFNNSTSNNSKMVQDRAILTADH